MSLLADGSPQGLTLILQPNLPSIILVNLFPLFLPLVPNKASSTSHLPPSQRPFLFQTHVKDGPDTP